MGSLHAAQDTDRRQAAARETLQSAEDSRQQIEELMAFSASKGEETALANRQEELHAASAQVRIRFLWYRGYNALGTRLRQVCCRVQKTRRRVERAGRADSIQVRLRLFQRQCRADGDGHSVDGLLVLVVGKLVMKFKHIYRCCWL